MKNFEKLNNLKSAAKNIVTSNFVVKNRYLLTSAAVAIAANPNIVFATNIDNMFGSLIGIVCKIFFYIGSILLIWSIGQLVMSFKNDDADSKQRAIQTLVVSILLMSVGTIYTAITNGMAGHIAINNDIKI